MHRSLFVVGLVLLTFQRSQQIQIPLDDDLSVQVVQLQKNVSELWTYIHQLRNAVSSHLNHLRQHQLELENTVHDLTHHSGGQSHAESHTDDHHSHSEEHHSHGDDQHSHSDYQHSHGNDHHTHSDDHHTHGDHSAGNGQHSHGGHSSEHYDNDHQHFHTGDSHAQSAQTNQEGSADHHHHKDSHEKSDDIQQNQQEPDPLPVPASRHPSTNHLHQHGNQLNRTHSRVVVIPKYTEYDLYEFAVCNVQPNKVNPEDEQQDVTGQVSLWQKKIGGPLYIHVNVQGFNMEGHNAVLQEEHAPAASHKHGFHVHALGDISNGCDSAGSHYDPKSAFHAGPTALDRHVGDLGNIECDEHGISNLVFTDEVASLTGQYSIVGKTIVIHASADDLGAGDNDESLRTGNAGRRLACCVIQKVEKLPIRLYRAIKTAKRYRNY